MKKLRIIKIGNEFLEAIFRGELRDKEYLNWPADAHIVSVQSAFDWNGVLIKVTSDTFDEVAYGELIPAVDMYCQPIEMPVAS